MFSRIRIAFGITLLVALAVSIPVFAKGNFAFVTITGPNLKEAVRTTNPALTTDFLAFFDFADKAKEPADPGVGYLVTRYYIDGKKETAFDHLHYYPDTGFVYYDGIVNGGSEYDGKWYTANPEIKTVFEKALPGKAESVEPAVQQPIPVSGQTPASKSNFQTRVVLLTAVAIAVVIILIFALRFRRTPTR